MAFYYIVIKYEVSKKIAGIGTYFFLKHKSIKQPDGLSKPATNKQTKPEPKKSDSNVESVDNEAEKLVEPINTSADRKTGGGKRL
ncbi:MAG: hypothetical protein LBL90_07940 [Prevotellaceae bacterium]|jgi:predicted P-loop ATPase/GTPase|nr:hypothetical protein [Prevotellaceae bacterium]